MIRNLATDLRFQVAFLLLGVAISVPVGLVTESLGWAVVVVSTFSIVMGLCKHQQARSN
jgi:hypothetical protein